jgi:hypothetical protein
MRAIASPTDSRSAICSVHGLVNLSSFIASHQATICMTALGVPKNHHLLAFLVPFFSFCYLFLLLCLIIHRLSASNPVTNLPALPYTTKQFRYCGLGSIKGSSAAAVGTCRWVETSCWKACASSAKCGLEARCVHGRMSLSFELWWWELWLVGRQSENDVIR